MEPPRKRRRFSSVNNVAVDTIRSQLTGSGYTRYSQVTESLLEKYGDEEGLQTTLDVIVCFEGYLHSPHSTPHTIYQKAKELFQLVSCFERRTTDEVIRFEREEENARLFSALGGIDIVKSIIMLESLLPKDSVHRQESEEKLRMKAVLFQCIMRIITTDSVGEQVARDLAADDEFMIQMFYYLQYKQTFLSACSLLEDILQNRPVLILSTIPRITEIISRLEGDKFMNFCRILAVTVSDLDVYDNKISLFAQNKQKRGEGFVNIRDLNQEFLLQIPSVIKKLVDFACKQDYSPRYTGLNGEVENWMQWIDDSNSDDLLDLPDSDVDVSEFISGVTQPTDIGAPWALQPAMSIVNSLVYKVEAVHVLGLLLLGKHRRRTQKMVSEMKLIPGLSAVFENFVWKVRGNRTGAHDRLAGHNPSCQCSPEVAIKIQVMRVIHSFCDHSEYKHLMLTRSELAEVQRINEKAGLLQIQGLDQVDKNNMCKGKVGLLAKIVEVLKKEPTDSTFCFWFCRVIDSYLRGTTSFCDQVFLLRRGVLQHIVGKLLDGEQKTKEILQSSFDLLAELMKFNIEAFKIAEDVLRTTELRKKFRELTNSYIVDSNMFIRSTILSYFFFCNEQPEYADYSKNVNYMLSYIGDFQHQVNYLHELVSLTTVHNISQANVSCLNTALVLLMCANKTSSVVPYLQALREGRLTCNNEVMGGHLVINNFRELLVFWADHYLSRDKDCSALEKSTRIPFSEWKRTVEMLIDEDSSKPTSLSHYLT